MTHYQTTVREPLAFEGVGLHSGAPCRVAIRPAAPGTGLRFISAGVEIPALAEYVVETARATVIGKDGVTISTVEHLLAALFGMGISNAELVVVAEGVEFLVDTVLAVDEERLMFDWMAWTLPVAVFFSCIVLHRRGPVIHQMLIDIVGVEQGRSLESVEQALGDRLD